MQAPHPRAAILLCVALGIALGMVGWALFIHDGGGAGSSTPAAQKGGR